MKYTEIPEFKNGMPEWLYNLKEEERQKYDFELTDKGWIVHKTFSIKPADANKTYEMIRAGQKKELDKIHNEFKKDTAVLIYMGLVAIGLIFIYLPILLKLSEIITTYPLQVAFASLIIGLAGLYILSRSKNES